MNFLILFVSKSSFYHVFFDASQKLILSNIGALILILKNVYID